jgi:hypothetical protein
VILTLPAARPIHVASASAIDGRGERKSGDSADKQLDCRLSAGAPSARRARFTVRANALSFNFFFTARTSTSLMLFEGRQCYGYNEAAQLIDSIQRFFAQAVPWHV